MAQQKRPFVSLDELEAICAEHPTPFYLYDERGIRERAQQLVDAFAWCPGFKEYFAVKATPNPAILSILREYGFGLDCSSECELMLAEALGFRGDEIMFSSNDTPDSEFAYAARLGARVNLDDITHIDAWERAVGEFPSFMSLRFNPGGDFAFTNGIFDSPERAKFGLTEPQMLEAARELSRRGVRELGIHALLASNTVTNEYFPALARLLFGLAVRIQRECGVRVSLVNLSGGVGVAYRPEETPNDIAAIGEGVRRAFEEVLVPAGMGDVDIACELGRFMLAPFAGLVCRVTHEKHIYRDYLGVDACAANLMRPMLYAHHGHGPRGRARRPHLRRRRHAVREQRPPGHGARPARDPRRRPAVHPRRGRPRPLHGLQLQRSSALGRAAAARGRHLRRHPSRTIRAFEENPFISEIVVVTREDLLVPIAELSEEHEAPSGEKSVPGGSPGRRHKPGRP